MKLVLQYFYKKRQVIGWSILCGLIYLLIFSLSGIDLKAAVYPALLCLVFGIVFLLAGFFRFIERHRRLEFLEKDKGPYGESLPKAADLCEADYQKLLKKEEQEWRDRQKVWDDTMSDMEDYYAAWVHQIKDPIAVMQVLLQQEDTEQNRELKAELFRVEQYAEMALSYVRLNERGGGFDLVAAEYALDPVIRKAIRKYASQFIRKKIQVVYQGTDEVVLTDEKWLSFIVEQILSNAVKYTQQGSVTIRVEGDRQLVIEDTGIGIAAEDIPRIFEKGYTGENGKLGKKSTGIGLYLSQMAAKKLGHTISVESIPGEGSSFKIDLSSYDLQVE